MSEKQSDPELSVVILCYHSADVVRSLALQAAAALSELEPTQRLNHENVDASRARWPRAARADPHRRPRAPREEFRRPSAASTVGATRKV